MKVLTAAVVGAAGVVRAGVGVGRGVVAAVVEAAACVFASTAAVADGPESAVPLHALRASAANTNKTVPRNFPMVTI